MSQSVDKYYILQVIVAPGPKYCCFARWGRTGTPGQSKAWDAKDESDAIELFTAKYTEQTSQWVTEPT